MKKTDFPTLAEVDRLVANIEALRPDPPSRFVATIKQRALRQIRFDWRRVENAVAAIKTLPREMEYHHIIAGPAFCGMILLPALLAVSGAKSFSEIRITTLGFSKRNIEELAAMIKAGLIPASACRIIAGEFFRKKDSDVWHFARSVADRVGFGLRSARCHAKVMTAHLAAGFYVVESSANLRACFSAEQITLVRSRALYRFHRNWIDSLFESAAD